MANPIRPWPSFPAEAGNFRRDRPGNPRAGSCTLCRSSKASAARPCVDLGPNSQAFREGRVVVCANCAERIGECVGMLSAADRERMEAQVAELAAEVARLNAELLVLARLREALAGIKSSVDA